MFWRGVLGYLPANAVQGIVGLLTIVTFTRLLSPAQFGAYALGFSVMSILHTAVFTWAEAAMARFWAGAEARDETGPLVASLHRAWALLALVLPVAALITWVWPMSQDLRLAVLAGLAAIFPRTFVKLAQERRRAAGDVRSAAGLDMAQTAGGFAIGAGLALAGLGGAAPLLGMATAAAACAPLVIRTERGLARTGRVERARLAEHAAYGLPVALSLLLALVLATTDRFLLAHYLDAATVGVYHAGYSLANRTLDVVFIWLGAAGGPALVMAMERGGPDALARSAREQAGLMVLITLPAAVGLALVSAPLAQLMIGPQLAVGAARVTPWIALSGLLGGLTTYYFHQAFTLARRTPMLIAAMLIPAGANVVLNMLLIPRFGLDGALWATPISFALGLVASALLGARQVRLPVPWLTLAQAASASLIMALAVSRIPAFGGLLELGLKAATGALVYGGLIALVDAGALRSRGQALLRARRGSPA